jgi:hypothetical protein
MPRGGFRVGAGRKRGSKDKKKATPAARAPAPVGVPAALCDASRMAPLDILLASARKLFESGEFSQASLAAARCAPFLHQRFKSSDEPAQLHSEQKVGPKRASAIGVVPHAGEAIEVDHWGGLLN